MKRARFIAGSSCRVVWGESGQKNLKFGHLDALDVGGTRVKQSKSAGRLMGSGATAMSEKTS